MSGAETCDVAVIGRGMIGSAAARHLAESGSTVALIGPDEPADRLSSQGPFCSHPDQGRITRIAGRTSMWTEVAARSIARYRDIGDRAGVEFHTPCGFVAVYPDAVDWVKRGAAFGSQVHEIDAETLYADTGIVVANGLESISEPAPAGFINPRRLVAAQTALVAQAGATVVNDAVQAVHRRDNGFEIAGRFGTVTARQILVATGAFGSQLFDWQLDVQRRPRTTVAARLALDPRLPAFIMDQPPDDRVHEIYWVPPVAYPDGSVRIKIGGNLREFSALGEHDLVDWFHTDGDPIEIESLTENLHALLPDAALGDIVTAPCVITGTTSEVPYIGWAETGLAVAIGGNGSAAKSSDELGRLAASLFSEAGWDSTLDQAQFEPRFC